MGNKKLMKKNRSKSKQKSQNQEETAQEEQNKNVLIEKTKLLKMNAEKQEIIIKEVFQKITLNPQQNFKHVQTLFTLSKVQNLKIVSIALRTLSEMFVNIAPLQAIDIKKLQTRTQTQITKDQYLVIKFQKNIVQQYERYLKMLKELNMRAKIVNFNHDKELFRQFKKCLLQCIIKLFNTLWNFNCSKQLCELLLKFVKFQQCRTALKNLLGDKNISTVATKIKIITGIGQLIKKNDESTLPGDLIKVLNSVCIDSRYLQKDRNALIFRKKKLKQKLYRQEALQKKSQKQKNKNLDKLQLKKKRKQQKAMEKMKVKEQVNKQFAQGQAIISNKQVVRNNSMILQEMFYIYFKILVQQTNSKFLKDCLDGILKFAHLINIDLIVAMIQHLNKAAQIFRILYKNNPKDLKIIQLRLIIVFTAQSILNGPLSIYNMDDLTATSNFYRILRDINSTPKLEINKQIFRLICITLEEAFVKRRQLSQQVVGSFLRQIAIFLKRQEVPKMYLLQLIRLCGSKYGKVSKMFQDDNEGFGINSYNSACEDPQSTNAINTQIVSHLKTLQKNNRYSPTQQQEIKQYVKRLSRQNFLRIEGTMKFEDILKNQLAVKF